MTPPPTTFLDPILKINSWTAKNINMLIKNKIIRKIRTPNNFFSSLHGNDDTILIGQEIQCMQDFFYVYFSHIQGISWECFWYIFGLSMAYPLHIPDISPAYPRQTRIISNFPKQL